MGVIDTYIPRLAAIVQFTEWGGAFLAIAGALILSMNRPWSRFAWPVWILSNLLLVVATAHGRQWGLVTMQLAFLIVNVNGWARCRPMPGTPAKCITQRGGRGDDRQP